MISIQWIRNKAEAGDYKISSHAEEERRDEMITALDLRHALCHGKVLEQYENRKDKRGDSCLVLGPTERDHPLHVVVGQTVSKDMRIVTVYIPKPPQWLDPQTRG